LSRSIFSYLFIPGTRYCEQLARNAERWQEMCLFTDSKIQESRTNFTLKSPCSGRRLKCWSCLPSSFMDRWTEKAVDRKSLLLPGIEVRMSKTWSVTSRP